jgi:hypothetical protein
MLKFVLAATLIVLSLSFARNADAFIDPPYLTPGNPVAGEPVSVSIRAGVCDGVGSIPGYPQITQTGDTIRILLWGSSFVDPILCNLPIGTSTYQVGAFSEGAYVLRVDREYMGDLGDILSETLGIIPFTVSGPTAEPVALPASDSIGIGTLVLMLAACGMRHRGLATPRLACGGARVICASGHAPAASPDPKRRDHIVGPMATSTPDAPAPEQIIT